MAKTKTFATADSQPVTYRGWKIRLDIDGQRTRHNVKGYLYMWAIDEPGRPGSRVTALTLEGAKTLVDTLIAGVWRF